MYDQNKSEVVKTKECVDCKQPFNLTQRDMDFIEQNNFTEYTRCYPCRKKKREQKQSGQRGGGEDGSRSGRGGSGSNGHANSDY